ncbi:hypothetical protein SESBI_23436 [Sesbania bispinosa]|nr:hypothetical protein SESBI_23436 [Sesbania bispinosa]
MDVATSKIIQGLFEPHLRIKVPLNPIFLSPKERGRERRTRIRYGYREKWEERPNLGNFMG